MSRSPSTTAPPGWLAVADADQLDQVLWALLDNAVKYGGRTAGSTVEIADRRGRVAPPDHDRRRRAGRPEDDRGRLFGRFVRGADRSPDEGSGLGPLRLARAVPGDGRRPRARAAAARPWRGVQRAPPRGVRRGGLSLPRAGTPSVAPASGPSAGSWCARAAMQGSLQGWVALHSPLDETSIRLTNRRGPIRCLHLRASARPRARDRQAVAARDPSVAPPPSPQPWPGARRTRTHPPDHAVPAARRPRSRASSTRTSRSRARPKRPRCELPLATAIGQQRQESTRRTTDLSRWHLAMCRRVIRTPSTMLASVAYGATVTASVTAQFQLITPFIGALLGGQTKNYFGRAPQRTARSSPPLLR